jgi:hypothetical protein
MKIISELIVYFPDVDVDTEFPSIVAKRASSLCGAMLTFSESIPVDVAVQSGIDFDRFRVHGIEMM